MSLVLRIDRSGFVSGENIIINAECSNMTNVKIDYTKAVVHQTITYHAEGRKKKDHRKVAELKRLEIPPGEDDNWNNVEMLVPALPPLSPQYAVAYIGIFLRQFISLLGGADMALVLNFSHIYQYEVDMY
ncbi:uncharacterized protein LOC122243279 [Penaeus japonicus]|uniref:uncharacterized protein LOC122243279 n=1 Tax=Penaeus japonicus TaxID=27405 RepID=UPI001C715A7A|nr:uncharacterized protein LOC122243279 [Penaeus japonicus]